MKGSKFLGGHFFVEFGPDCEVNGGAGVGQILSRLFYDIFLAGWLSCFSCRYTFHFFRELRQFREWLRFLFDVR